ncbi:hypothetical protein L6164_021006 [Bauhinia variegata]|uniref:Uncharacterized protein n=1 Tax=Bauhinia variegata TaxID=167791 RepID=A0ACB9MXC6_BAUVA|nr:hypothetical protein L6164_021006 [Bauhinia variegata]
MVVSNSIGDYEDEDDKSHSTKVEAKYQINDFTNRSQVGFSLPVLTPQDRSNDRLVGYSRRGSLQERTQEGEAAQLLLVEKDNLNLALQL